MATQIIAQVATSQYGGQCITLSHLAPFVQVSRDKARREVREELESLNLPADDETVNEIAEMRVQKEIERGVQIIQYQVITLMTTNGQAPFITVFMYLNEVEDEQTRRDLASIIEAVLKQRILGVKNEKGVYITPAFPKLIYVLEENNIHEDSEYYYLTKLAAQCTAKRMVPDYISEKTDAGTEEGQKRRRPLLSLHGLPFLPDSLCQRRRQTAVLRPLQPGRSDHQPGGCRLLLQTG